METSIIYSDKEVEVLASKYATKAWYAGLLQYSFSSFFEDALSLIPPIGLLKIGILLNRALPQHLEDSVSIHNARKNFIEQAEDLSEEQIEKRAAFFDIIEECLQDIPMKDWPLIYLDDDFYDNAYYSASSHVIVFSLPMIEKFEKGDQALRFLVGHELGHSVLKHVEKEMDLQIKKTATMISAAILTAGFFSLASALWTGITIGAGFNYTIHKTSIQCELEADAYAVTVSKSADGAKKLFKYILSEEGSVYNRFIEQGFTEEQACRLAGACEQASFSHPSHWERMQKAELLAAQL